MNKSELSKYIKKKAIAVGFNGVGISKAQEIVGFESSLNQWLAKGYHAEMDYMSRNKEKRANPQLLVEGAKSVISLIVSYYPNEKQGADKPQVAKYAYGTDYHFVLKDRMQLIWDGIQEYYPELDGRIFVDSAPVSDKLWAVQAGLGWIGKNACLINREVGSFVFIAELIVNVELDYDEPYRSSFCGSCTKCIDACPTQAIVEPGVIDSNKCISYLTIENKNDFIPEKFKGLYKKQVFGCDLCQDVCPWNKKPIPTSIAEFKPHKFILESSINDWASLDQENFSRVFKNSALKRSKLKGIKRNLNFIAPK